MIGDVGEPTSLLSLATITRDDRICVKVDGEIDTTTADEFTSAMTAVIDRRPALIIIGLARLRFMDSSGIAALNRTTTRARDAATPLLVINCQPGIQRALEISGLYEPLTQAAARKSPRRNSTTPASTRSTSW